MITSKALFRSVVTLLAALLVLGAAAVHLIRFDPISDTGWGEISDEDDASTPQGRLALFLASGNEVRLRLAALERERVRSGKLMYPSLSEKSRFEMAILTERLMTSLDLSAVPLAMRENVGIEAALMLSEALRLKGVSAATPLVSRNSDLWSVGNTHIEISTANVDPQHKGYLFTPTTIADAELLYDAAKASAPASQATAFDAYTYYMKTPGQLVPPVWAGLVLRLPDVWQQLWGGNTLWQWGSLLLAVTGLFAIPASVSWHVPQRSRIFWIAVSLGAYAYFAETVVINEVNITGKAEIACYYLFGAVAYVSTAVGIILFFEWLAHALIRQYNIHPTNVDASMVKLGSRAIGFAIAIAIICVGASQAGIPVLGMITGFGIGGVATALAAKPTLENLIASVVMFLDRPARIGDKIEADDVIGVIERIGLRSTRIRGEDGRLFNITNSDLAERVIVNLSTKDR